MTKSKLFFALACLFVGFCLMVLQPVPIPDSAEECLVVKGVVEEIFEGGEKDVLFKISGHDSYYYINRGLEQGLELANLQHKLMGKEVEIRYPDYWTPLDPQAYSRHLSVLTYKGKILFSEI